MDEQQIKNALKHILDKLSDKEVEWQLAGSANLKLQGIDVSVSDIDISTNEAGIIIFRDVLKPYIVKDFFNRKINGHSLVCNIKNAEVEINTYKNTKLLFLDKTEQILWHNLHIPITPLKYAREFYALIHRKEKVEIIDQYLAKGYL